MILTKRKERTHCVKKAIEVLSLLVESKTKRKKITELRNLNRKKDSGANAFETILNVARVLRNAARETSYTWRVASHRSGQQVVKS